MQPDACQQIHPPDVIDIKIFDLTFRIVINNELDWI